MGFLASIFLVPTVAFVIPAVSGDVFIGTMLFVFGLLITSFSSLCLGVPGIIFLRKANLLNAEIVSFFGALAGAISLAYVAYSLNFYPQLGNEYEALTKHAIPSTKIGSALGFISALAFCVGAGIKSEILVRLVPAKSQE
ncbi:MAG: hypothetical protein KBT87_01385 [Gammaproteobacteria bacterium]|jgi:hypothetical protein|nr:hypothetical protein [Gammaproteobacteria bacterium]MBQ0773305.1 hypothetical protein [Gammaproteobacteria bacterium]